MDSVPVADSLQLPIEPYEVTGYRFKQRIRRRIILWATHLGDDVVAPAGMPVWAVGAGRVVWCEVRPGSPARRNWGGLVVLAHRHRDGQQAFYSVYGHITDLTVQTGDTVERGQRLGVVAAGNTPENGWWQKPHLHFGIYTGPWRDTVLPGYKRPEEWRTRVRWWQDPAEFIEHYNN